MLAAIIASGLLATSADTAASPASYDTLRDYLRARYPSLEYVEQFRKAYPQDVQDLRTIDPETVHAAGVDGPTLVKALMGLSDQHVAVGGQKAGAAETLGVLFRTSSDGHAIVWRVFDPRVRALHRGDEIISINGRPTAAWLSDAARVTFGGNRRSRQAEAALNLAAGTPLVHTITGVTNGVSLSIRSVGETKVRTVSLRYSSMGGDQIAALNAAVNQSDLPSILTIGTRRIGVVRIGAFAPQYDPVFNSAADAIPEDASQPDKPMLAGFCAVVREFISEYDSKAAHADVMVIDLRGNMGGFGREARLLSWAITGIKPPKTWDVFSTAQNGLVSLEAQPDDASCGTVQSHKPVIALTDGGVRSAGEFLASWLWASRVPIIGERTVGAGGGFEAGSQGTPWGSSGYNVRISGNFTIFDPTSALSAGPMKETDLVAVVAQDAFKPSLKRPYAVQAVGLRPDIETFTTIDDLRDGGKGLIERNLERAVSMAEHSR